MTDGPLPTRNHRGAVTFAHEDEGTRINWVCTCESRVPGLGWIMKIFIKYVFNRSLKDLHKFPFETLDN